MRSRTSRTSPRSKSGSPRECLDDPSLRPPQEQAQDSPIFELSTERISAGAHRSRLAHQQPRALYSAHNSAFACRSSSDPYWHPLTMRAGHRCSARSFASFMALKIQNKIIIMTARIRTPGDLLFCVISRHLSAVRNQFLACAFWGMYLCAAAFSYYVGVALHPTNCLFSNLLQKCTVRRSQLTARCDFEVEAF